MKALKNSSVYISLVAIAGCGLGNWLSYFLWPQNYLGGWEVFRLFSSKGSIVGSYGISRWLEVTGQRIPYLFPVFSLMFVMGVAIVKRKMSNDARTLLPILYAGTFFGGYFLSSWGAFPRYFASALIGWTVVVAIYHRAVLASIRTRTLWVGLGLFAITSTFYISQGWAEMFVRQSTPPLPMLAPRQQQCIPVMGVTEAYVGGKPNYVDFNLTESEARAWAAKYGRTVCETKK